MFKVAIFLGLAAFASSQYAQDYNNIPNPYQFSYSAPSEGGQSSHQEQGDGNGRVTGSYSVQDEDGRYRTVEYVADEQGFRASISTNEPGTSNQAPADVNIQSSADGGAAGAAAQYGAAPAAQYGAAPAVQYGAAPAVQYGAAPAVQYGPAPAIQYGAAPVAAEVVPAEGLGYGGLLPDVY